MVSSGDIPSFGYFGHVTVILPQASGCFYLTQLPNPSHFIEPNLCQSAVAVADRQGYRKGRRRTLMAHQPIDEAADARESTLKLFEIDTIHTQFFGLVDSLEPVPLPVTEPVQVYSPTWKFAL